MPGNFLELIGIIESSQNHLLISYIPIDLLLSTLDSCSLTFVGVLLDQVKI